MNWQTQPAPATQADDDTYGYRWDAWNDGHATLTDLDYLAGHELTTATERALLEADLTTALEASL